jgi:hypothetical protein
MGRNVNIVAKRGPFDELPDRCKPVPDLPRFVAPLCLNSRIRLNRKRQHIPGASESSTLALSGPDRQIPLLREASSLNDGIRHNPFGNPVAFQLTWPPPCRAQRIIHPVRRARWIADWFMLGRGLRRARLSQPRSAAFVVPAYSCPASTPRARRPR